VRTVADEVIPLYSSSASTLAISSRYNSSSTGTSSYAGTAEDPNTLSSYRDAMGEEVVA
jgi:hypothetical protein